MLNAENTFFFFFLRMLYLGNILNFFSALLNWAMQAEDNILFILSKYLLVLNFHY